MNEENIYNFLVNLEKTNKYILNSYEKLFIIKYDVRKICLIMDKISNKI